MRKLSVTLAASLLLTNAAFAKENYSFTNIDGVAELFTSQGCSSCPPADRLMGKIKQADPNKLVLTYAVTIWDYLGWRDQFATKKNTQRQRDYSAYMGLSSIYTPQGVVNGSIDVVGSYGRKINQHFKQSKLLKSDKLNLKISQKDMKLSVEIGEAGSWINSYKRKKSDPIDATLWLVKYRSKEDVQIDAGENEGKTISYHNVVGDFMPIGMWEGKKETFHISYRDLKGGLNGKKTDKFAFLLQMDGNGAIIGGAKVN